MADLTNSQKKNEKKIEAIVKDLPVVKDQGDVELLYKIAEKLGLRETINNHVSKTAGIDVGTQIWHRVS